MNIPQGFAPIFDGWNVWDVYQSQKPVEGLGDAIMTAGLSLDRQLKIWVENAIKEGAPGAAVADPANPAALRGDQIQIIPRVTSLPVAVSRASLPDLGGSVQLGAKDSPVLNCTVRFYNRGPIAFLPWPNDQNYLLNNVYLPDAHNPITSGAAPSSLPGTLHDIGAGVSGTLDTMAWVLGLGLGAVVLLNLVRRK